MSDLLARLDALIDSSTAPSTTDADLRTFVELKLQAQSGRGAAAALRSAERSARIEAIVERAAEHVSRRYELRDATAIVRHKLQTTGEWFGLRPGEAVPCDRVIRRVVRNKFGLSEPKVPHVAHGRCYRGSTTAEACDGEGERGNGDGGGGGG